MISYRGVNCLTGPNDVRPELLEGIASVHLSGYVFSESPQREAGFMLMELARLHKIPVSLDTGLDPVLDHPEDFKRALARVSVLITGWDESVILTGEKELDRQLDAYIGMGLETAAIKLGKQGAVLAHGKERVRQPGFKTNVIDTTGAGDAFSAGLLVGLRWRLSAPACLLLANGLGGYATETLGSARITPDSLRRFLIAHKGELNTELWPSMEEILTSLEDYETLV